LSILIIGGLSFLLFHKDDPIDQYFSGIKYHPVDVKFMKRGQKGIHSAKLTVLDGRFERAEFRGMAFKDLTFDNATVFYQMLQTCSFERVKFSFIHIDTSQYEGVLFSHCNFDRGEFNEVQMQYCRFYNDTISGTLLKNCQLNFCEFKHTMFEPDSLPDVNYLATATGLDELYYKYKPGPLFNLKKAFENKGFNLASLKVNTAIRRSENQENNLFSKTLNYIFLDLTYEYGSNLSRPFFIYLISIFVFGCCYWFFCGMDELSYILVNEMPLGPGKYYKMSFVPDNNFNLKNEWLFFKTAMLYSFTRSLRLGFGLFDFSKWIQMLQIKEKNFSETHYLKVLAGMQSLISIYLIFLWITASFKL